MRTLLLIGLAALCGCASKRPEPNLEAELLVPVVGDEIVVCGERFRTSAPVVLWTDPFGYDATSAQLHFDPPPEGVEFPEPGTLRYQPGRWDRSSGVKLVAPRSEDLLVLQSVVDTFVLHYDASGVSRRCFQVLHDRRGLSTHFMIDLDGTIYQTMDLRDTAWHASEANTRSIGVELANIGAYRLDDARGLATLESWYTEDLFGRRIALPEELRQGGVRTRGFVGRPARRYPVRGVVQSELRLQYDFTPEQYDSLVKLTASLCRIFPRMRADAPRDSTGNVRTDVLSDEEFDQFLGIVGHYHVDEAKSDPGPALQWDLYLSRVQTRLRAGRGAAHSSAERR